MSEGRGAGVEAVVLDRVAGRAGELVLRRRAGLLEVVSAGVFLMDTSDGRSERLLVRETVTAATPPDQTTPTGAPPDRAVLLGGLGVGFSLLEALTLPEVREVVVVELEPAVVRWHRDGPLGEVTGDALDDPRVTVVVDDVLDLLDRSPGSFDAVCLDTDNGPDWLVQPSNAAIYSRAGLDTAGAALRPGGAVGFWSASASAGFEEALRTRFHRVARHEVPVARGEPDVVWVASGSAG